MSARDIFQRKFEQAPDYFWLWLKTQRKRVRHHNSDKTHCPRGHDYSMENTAYRRKKSGRVHRACKACMRAAQRDFISRNPRPRKIKGPLTGQAMINANKTHCPRGHEYNKENTYVWANSRGRKLRICRTCGREGQRMRKRSAVASRKG